MTDRTYNIVRGTMILVVFLGLIGWVLIRCLRRSEEPVKLVVKWILTVPVVWFLYWRVGPMAQQGGLAAVFCLPLLGVCAVALVVIWRQSISDLVAKPFGALYDGGLQQPIPQPAYSMAQAKQKKGLYLEAVDEIRRQLERFPTDFEGQMLLAQIQAEDLKDLRAAESTIESFCAQPGHAPQSIVFALYSMADWQLQIGRDRAAAERSLQKVVERFPESELALGAAQRIAHLGTAEMLLAPEDRRKFVVPEGVRSVGLRRGHEPVKAPETSPEEVAADYVKHLQQHPLDMEARENLAIIYADHYGRLDLAASELEQMIEYPNQPGRLVVHWLNLLADLQIRHGAGYETVRETIQRIVDRDPKAAAAEIARNRLGRLRLEFKGKDQSQAVKLGSYEQNIGLKRGLPAR